MDGKHNKTRNRTKVVEHLRPILYKSTEKVFSDNGIGVLSDVLSCIVEEERNGAYELTMEYPVGGAHFSELVSRAIILAKPNSLDRPQPFRIYQIGKPLGGVVTVYAQHISYDLSGVAVAPINAVGIDNVITAMMENAIPTDHGFTLTTDKAGSTGIATNVPSSFRSLLGGTEGSLLDIYGGEYKYDRYTVTLMNKRGTERDFTIRYGQNMTSFEQEENCAAVYTDVYPYWASGEEKVFLDEKTVRASGSYDFTKVLPLDLSSYFESVPSKADLKAAAENYMTANKIGVPTVSLKLSYEEMGEHQNEPIGLCDTVTVVFPKLNVNTEAQIVRVEYDVLMERYKSLEIGSTVSNLADTIVNNAVDPSKILSAPSLQQAIANATAWLTRSTGGHIIFKRNSDGGLSEILILDTADEATATNVWRWNSGGLGFSHDGGRTYDVAITQDGHIVGSFVTALGLSVDAANVSGKIKAGTIDASELIVKAGKIDGQLTANQIDVTDLKVTSANIDHLYAKHIEGGTTESGYIASGAISNADCYLDSLYVTTLTNNKFNGASIYLTSSEDNKSYSVTLTATGISVSSSGVTPTVKTWQDILSGSNVVPKFG